jgi:uncharacterized LabA/DUF88 family protein
VSSRVTFLIDGFNLYHSVVQAQGDTKIHHLKWLDIGGLLRSYLSVFGRDAVLAEIHYFTAYAHHLTPHKPDVVNRHRTYIEALKGTGVQVQLARFKKKASFCPHCRKKIIRHEEKETDVSVALKALEILHQDACDTLVLVSGDTDLAPAIRTAKRLFPDKQICIAFPHARFNAELQQLSDFSFRIRGSRYAHHQFPDPLLLPSGRQISKPQQW